MLSNEPNEELRAILDKQNKQAILMSIISGILLILFLALVFYWLKDFIFSNKAEPIVTYASEEVKEEEPEKEKVSNSIQKKPEPPSSSTTPPLLLAIAPSSVAIPIPDIQIDTLSVNFGEQMDFGSGFGSGSGDGDGGGGGNFMGSKLGGDLVCFVIDYSTSMAGERINLLKRELESAISNYPMGKRYQVIFFAGPAWIAGSTVDSSVRTASVSKSGSNYSWSATSPHDWVPNLPMQPVEWISCTAASQRESITAVKETELVYGTSWKGPFEMALSMSPTPYQIVFLTDGVSGEGSLELAKQMGANAKSKGVIVNTISLMEPRARDAMASLARATGGSFSMIGEDGKKQAQ
jgi:hypothetical protein